MKICVTGGAGFIGSNIVDAYITDGHEVVVLDNLTTGDKKNLNRQALFYEVDITDSSIEKIFEREKFDCINHHAAQMDVRKSVEDPLYDAEVNVLGTINLLQKCVKYQVPNFIYASTGGAIYGEQEYFPADEMHPIRPLSPYGVAKEAGERYLYFYHHTYGINYTVLRYANVYGPRQNPNGEAGVIAIFTSRFLAGDTPVINGDGKQTRDYIYINDVVEINRIVLNRKQYECFNVGTGIETDVNTLYRKLNIDGKDEDHGPLKPGEQKRSVLDSSHAKEVLNWGSKVSIDEGLRLTMDFFRGKMKSINEVA